MPILFLKNKFLLILHDQDARIEAYRKSKGESFMADAYGSDYITIEDEDGVEYELEVLTTLDYNGSTYLAVVPADSGDEGELEVSILKSVEEDGEEILCAIEDEEELETVYGLIMDSLYEEDAE